MPPELCLQLRSGEGIDAALRHIIEPGDGGEWKIDPLVAWAWDPGPGREPPPGTIDQFVRVMTWWKDGGAACPSK